MTEHQLLDLLRGESNPLNLLMKTANLLKQENGFEQDLLTPGFIKEWIVSEILGHDCHKTKHGADAYSKDGKEQYEYLTCKEGGSFQLDRIHKDNLHRITRNNKIFFAMFDSENGLECKKIWSCEPDIFLEGVKVKISKSRKESSKHVSFTDNWVKKNCQEVWSVQN